MNFTTILCIFRDCRFSPFRKYHELLSNRTFHLISGVLSSRVREILLENVMSFFFLFPCKIGENRREKRLTSKGSDKLRMFSMLSKANSSYWINWSVYKALFRFD